MINVKSVLLATLLTVLLSVARPGIISADTSATGNDISEIALTHPLADLSRDDLSETIDRPLFSSDRRPYVAPRNIARPKRAAPTRSRSARFRLLGILVAESEAVALVRNLSSGRNFRVRSGQKIDGWRADRITERQLTLMRNGEKSIVLDLHRKR